MIYLRSQPPELDALVASGHPFFKPAWGERVIGVAIDSEVDWDEVAELIAESYCIQAPKRLAAFVRDNREVVLEERSRLQDARARLKTRETDRLSDTTSARRADPTSVLDDYPEPLWESEQTPPDN